MHEINVGIAGFGTVGAGVAEGLIRHADLIAERSGVRPVIKRIADLDIETDRGVDVPKDILTTDVSRVLTGNDIDVVVELIGGTGIARECILEALAAGKPVVTANKALLAHHGEEIFAAAEDSAADVYYEASVAGGIPIIKALREGLAGNRIEEIVGILNGTCNYILTRMEQEHAGFDEILREAQEAGYAEADPAVDVDGWDAAHKTTILASLAYGEWFGMKPLHVEGIRGLGLQDVENARHLGYSVKLLAVIKQQNAEVQMRLHPALIKSTSLLANVRGVNNAVWVQGDMVGGTMYYGQGAGRRPTASAVMADIIDVGLNLKLGSHRRVPAFRPHSGYGNVVPMDDIVCRYYLRLEARNQPGVLARIAGALGEYNISIASLTQEEATQPSAPVIILTHQAREGDMKKALQALGQLEEIVQDPVFLRIEDLTAP